jgi:hypothetical protein
VFSVPWIPTMLYQDASNYITMAESVPISVLSSLHCEHSSSSGQMLVTVPLLLFLQQLLPPCITSPSTAISTSYLLPPAYKTLLLSSHLFPFLSSPLQGTHEWLFCLFLLGLTEILYRPVSETSFLLMTCCLFFVCYLLFNLKMEAVFSETS